jgi:23S rRNA pseudouridine1911/1915/1917 synthase
MGHVELVSPPEDAGSRLDVALAGPLGSRSRAARLIDAGAVTVDGVVKQRRYTLTGGEKIVVTEEEREEATATEGPQADFTIAYEDEDLFVVDKPAGVVVHPARGHWTGTLSQALEGRAAGGDEDRPGIVHRLDRDTSGLLVVARSEEAHRRLKAALQGRRITREYLTLVVGRPPARTGTIEASIGRDRRDRTRMSIDTDRPRDAVTHFEIEEALPHSTLLRVRLETGRTHQIRAHLEAIGHPVVGDPAYGTARQNVTTLGLDRQFLHAAHLAFAQPTTGAPVDVVSPLPADLQAALALARAGER